MSEASAQNSMAKSFQPGRAAQNGYTAALLGQADFTAGERALAAIDSPREVDGGGTRVAKRGEIA